MPAGKRDTTRILGSDAAPNLGSLRDSVIARALRGDTVGLVRLMLDDSAYRREIYPVSPAYDPDREEVFRFVLGMHKANSVKGLKRLLQDVGDSAGAPSRLLVEEFDGLKTSGGTLYALHEGETVPSQGIRPFGSAYCGRDGCRVVSYSKAGATGNPHENEE